MLSFIISFLTVAVGFIWVLALGAGRICLGLSLIGLALYLISLTV